MQEKRAPIYRGKSAFETAQGQATPNLIGTHMLRRDYVQSLERGFAIIQAFGPDRPTLTVAEAAEQTGLTRAAARRFLLTLASRYSDWSR